MNEFLPNHIADIFLFISNFNQVEGFRATRESGLPREVIYIG